MTSEIPSTAWCGALLVICLANMLHGTTPVAGASFTDAVALPAQTNLPNPLAMLDGTPVASKEAWFNRRRPELKALFQHYMYGYLPPAPDRIEFTVEREDRKFFGGKATKREVTIRLGPTNAAPIHLLLVVPNQRTKPAPVFLGLNFCGNHALLDDATIALPTGWMPKNCPGCPDSHATEAGRGKQIDVWAIEQSIDRGYAIATFYNGDVEPDRPEATEGIRAVMAKSTSRSGGRSYDWGTIAAWAWGLHRAVDYLHTNRDLDTNRLAVFGHSRNGKTALLAAAFDERIGLVIPHQAGCGGTAPSRGRIGESVKQINDRFPHWFNGEFKKFNEHTERLPFDQHCLMALVAPRPVLLSNAVGDQWANPAGQFEMLQAAEPVYRLLNAGNLDAKQMPETGRLIDSKLGYFIRAGNHSTTPEDWKTFLDFADRHFGKARP
jgi:hypothetical protein